MKSFFSFVLFDNTFTSIFSQKKKKKKKKKGFSKITLFDTNLLQNIVSGFIVSVVVGCCQCCLLSGLLVIFWGRVDGCGFDHLEKPCFFTKFSSAN